VNASAHDFTLLMWSLHTACREFFSKYTTRIFQRLVVDVTGLLTLSNRLPPALQEAAPTPIRRDASRTDSSPSDATIPGMSNKRQKTASGAPFAFRFRQDLNRAHAITKPKHFMAHQLCAGPQQIRTLFGADFLALVPHRKEPCIKHFIFGSCYAGNECKSCHSLSAEPSKYILDGVVKRVKAAIDDFLPKV
jgi:hypothetical protein